MNTWTCTRQGELYHHGIKGQKWGVRRFQNKDGSLTPAGRRRYDEPNERRDDAKKDKQYKIPKNKSLHRLQLEERYRKEGLSKKQAEQEAAKRIRTEAFVAAAAAITVGSCIAYAKYKGYTTDKIFKADSEFQRIMRLADNAEIKDGRQYLAFTKWDKVKYKGMLGDTLNKAAVKDSKASEKAGLGRLTDKVYDVTVKNKNEIRVASEKKARETFEKLYNEDMQFRVGVRKAMAERGIGFAHLNGKLQKVATKADNKEKFSNRELKKEVYDLFNIMLMDKTEQGVKNSNKFYDALRKQGVNALIDVNDKKYSGYKSKMPIITLDDGFEYSKRVMSNEEIKENFNKAYAKILVPEALKIGGAYAAIYSVTPIMNKYTLEKRTLEYKSKHPNTNMSDAEIKAMIKEQMEKEQEEW